MPEHIASDAQRKPLYSHSIVLSDDNALNFQRKFFLPAGRPGAFVSAIRLFFHEITSLIEAGIIRPVMDRVFPFEGTNDALA